MSNDSAPSAVVIVRTGLANLASWVAAFDRLGRETIITDDRTVIERAELLVLPGVGSAGPAMQMLRTHGLIDPLRSRILAGRPTLAVCLGLQLLANESEESPGEKLLGIVDSAVRAFATDKPVPQMGWNSIQVERGSGVLTHGSAYFANSYRLAQAPAGWRIALSTYGGERFVAAMEKGRVLACQFHPELSGPWGLALLRSWLENTPAIEQQPAAVSGSLCKRIIPCLDVRDGRVVKGVKFQGLRDAGDPVGCATRYERDGADELVILDVSATNEGRAAAVRTVDAVRRAISIPLTVGGGVRRIEDAARLLDAGADKVGVNTAAVHDPSLITALSQRFGRQCIVAAIDAARRENAPGWEVVTHAGTQRTGMDAVQWCAEVATRGAGEILLTSWDRDGTRSGYDLELLSAARGASPLPLIASGGAAGVTHLTEAFAAGADAVLAASIFHDQETTPNTLKHALLASGVLMRSPPFAEGAEHARALD